MFSQDFAAEKSATVGEGIDPTGKPERNSTIAKNGKMAERIL